MTTYSDWRTGPPPRACTACQANLAACESVLSLRGRPCCIRCDHPVTEGMKK